VSAVQRTGVGIWLFLGLSGIGIGCFSVLDNLYFRHAGYSIATIGALTATFNIALAVAELPSAVVFDRRSHWAAIQVGNAIRLVGLLLFSLALGPVGDFLGEGLAGIGAAAMSGTSVAYLLNRLGPVGSAERRRVMGFSVALGAATSLAGGALGLVGYTVAPRLIWVLGAFWIAVAGVVFFVGRPRTPVVAARHVEPLAAYVGGLIEIGRHPRAWLAITADAALVGPLLLWQLRLGATDVAAVFIGFVVMKVAGVLGGQLLGHRRVGPRVVLSCLAGNILSVGGFAATDHTALIVVFFGVHVMLQIAVSVYCRSELHAVVDDARRAGASSVVSLLGSSVSAVAALAVGRIADVWGAVPAMVPSIVLYLTVATLVIATAPALRSPGLAPRS
jgi:MFS family permease